MRSPALLVTPFIGARPDLRSLEGIARFAAEHGFAAVQLPALTPEILNLDLAAESGLYCSEVRSMLASAGLSIAGIAAARFGHFLAVPPASTAYLATLAPPGIAPNRQAWRGWAEARFQVLAQACRRLAVSEIITFGGSLLWPAFYPFPPLAEPDVGEAFAELAGRWRPILELFDANGVDVCFELHPGSDLHDGTTFERFLAAVAGHRRCAINFDPSHLLLQHMDYLGFVDSYGPHIRGFHVKDAEFIRSPRVGVYGGYNAWPERPGRFRSAGDGQIDFPSLFARLKGAGFAGWPVLEWECFMKDRFTAAAEGAGRIAAWTGRPLPDLFDAGMRRPLPRRSMEAIIGDRDERSD